MTINIIVEESLKLMKSTECGGMHHPSGYSASTGSPPGIYSQWESIDVRTGDFVTSVPGKTEKRSFFTTALFYYEPNSGEIRGFGYNREFEGHYAKGSLIIEANMEKAFEKIIRVDFEEIPQEKARYNILETVKRYNTFVSEKLKQVGIKPASPMTSLLRGAYHRMLRILHLEN